MGWEAWRVRALARRLTAPLTRCRRAALFTPDVATLVTWLGATHPPPKRTSRGHAGGTLPTPWAGKGGANQLLLPTLVARAMARALQGLRFWLSAP